MNHLTQRIDTTQACCLLSTDVRHEHAIKSTHLSGKFATEYKLHLKIEKGIRHRVETRYIRNT